MTNKEDSSSKKQSKKPVVAPFQGQSRFGGSGNGQFQQKSQYKPSPVRITQHKG